MSEKSQGKSSWWQTIPGLLTAVTGLLTAVTGLFLALQQLGWIGSESVTDPINSTTPSRTSKAKELAKRAYVIHPKHISARGHLESKRPKICVGSEIEDVEWKNLLRAYGLRDEIAIWSLTLDYYGEHMSDGTCLIALYSDEQAGKAVGLVNELNKIGSDPPYGSEAFRDIFNEWELKTE